MPVCSTGKTSISGSPTKEAPKACDQKKVNAAKKHSEKRRGRLEDWALKTASFMEGWAVFGDRNLRATGIPVVGDIAQALDEGDNGGAMNPTAKRFLLGMISSLLLATGFVHAAERFDPVSATVLQKGLSESARVASDDCTYTCSFANDLNEENDAN